MNIEIVKTEMNQVDVLAELQQTEDLVKAIMESRHYAKLGSEGVYAVVQKAKSMGINPMDALNGGIYYVQGKTEMSSQMMNRLIRSKGHSIKKDDKSTKSCCILNGKRVDNGDTWTISFSLEDAKIAGIYKPNGTWTKYPTVMCFNRALSMLARQLFPDVIVDCYVQGEISEAPDLHAPVVKYISSDNLNILNHFLLMDEDVEEAKKVIFERLNISSIDEIKEDRFKAMLGWLKERINDQKVEVEDVQVEVEVELDDKDTDIECIPAATPKLSPDEQASLFQS